MKNIYVVMLLAFALPIPSLSNAEGLRDIYESTPKPICTYESAEWIGLEKPSRKSRIDEYRFCVDDNILYRLSAYNTNNDKPIQTKVKKLGIIGRMFTIQGKLSGSGRQLTPDRRIQYEIENAQVVKYECTKKDCKKKIVERSIIAQPIRPAPN